MDAVTLFLEMAEGALHSGAPDAPYPVASIVGTTFGQASGLGQ